jgi:multidrug efflux pump subunit AcrB
MLAPIVTCARSQSEGFGDLGMVIGIALLLVYLLMVLLYNSYLHPPEQIITDSYSNI